MPQLKSITLALNDDTTLLAIGGVVNWRAPPCDFIYKINEIDKPYDPNAESPCWDTSDDDRFVFLAIVKFDADTGAVYPEDMELLNIMFYDLIDIQGLTWFGDNLYAVTQSQATG